MLLVWTLRTQSALPEYAARAVLLVCRVCLVACAWDLFLASAALLVCGALVCVTCVEVLVRATRGALR